MNGDTRGSRLARGVLIALLSLVAPAAAAPADSNVVPRAQCQAGDRPDTALQGQIPLVDRATGRATSGYTCNLTLVGGYQSRGFASFDTYRECAYVPDTSFDRLISNEAYSGGVVVVDASDVVHPKATARLTTTAALEPTESMRVNARRGLLVMDSNGPLGQSNDRAGHYLDVYDIAADCTHPKLLASVDMGEGAGHEGWFSPDGTVYYMTSLGMGVSNVFPVDLADPAHPKLMASWTGNSKAHGGAVSDDGNTAYECQQGSIPTPSPPDDGVRILDVSDVQAHRADPKAKLISFLPLADNQWCQGVYPVTYGGHPFLIQFGELTPGRSFATRPQTCGVNPSNFAAPHIVDIADPRKPSVVSTLMLEVDDPANCNAVNFDADPSSTGSTVPGVSYDVHHCSPDRLHDPTILACNQILSGLEVYDIRDPYHPKELAYYRMGTLGTQAIMHPDWNANPETVDDGIARPVVRASRGEIWFTSDYTGFHVAKFENGVYPFAGSVSCARDDDYFFDQYNPGRCGAARPRVCRRVVRLRVHGVRARRVRSLTVYVNGRRRKVRRGRHTVVRVKLVGGRNAKLRVRVVARTRSGRRVSHRRTYRGCKTSSEGAS